MHFNSLPFSIVYYTPTRKEVIFHLGVSRSLINRCVLKVSQQFCMIYCSVLEVTFDMQVINL